MVAKLLSIVAGPALWFRGLDWQSTGCAVWPVCCLASALQTEKVVGWLIQHGLLLHAQVPAAQESLDANCEELFDVVSCYFPISFTPPPDSVHGITRADLGNALQATLTCTACFAPLFVPMLTEKLSSSVRSASLHHVMSPNQCCLSQIAMPKFSSAPCSPAYTRPQQSIITPAKFCVALAPCWCAAWPAPALSCGNSMFKHFDGPSRMCDQGCASLAGQLGSA